MAVPVRILSHVGQEELARRGGSDAGRELSLPSLCPSGGVEHEGRLALNDLGLQRNHTLFVALQVLRMYHQPPLYRPLKFDVPRRAVWGEVPALQLPIDEGKVRFCCLADDVEIANRWPDRQALRVVGGDDLVRVAVEGVDIQRH